MFTHLFEKDLDDKSFSKISTRVATMVFVLLLSSSLSLADRTIIISERRTIAGGSNFTADVCELGNYSRWNGLNFSCSPDLQGTSSGETHDQYLNTTNNVTFNNILLTSPVSYSKLNMQYAGQEVLQLLAYQNGDYSVGYITLGNAFEETATTITLDGLYGKISALDWSDVVITESQISDLQNHDQELNITSNVTFNNIVASGVIRNVTKFGVVGTAAATAAKAVTIDGYSLTNGDLLAIKFTLGNSAASPTLNINGIGAKSIMLGNTAASAVTATIAANTTLLLYYNGISFQMMGSQRTTDTDTDTNADRLYRSTTITAGAAIYDYKLLMQNGNGKWYPLTLEEGVGTTKNVSTVEFNINSPIVYYASTTNVAINGTLSAVYAEYPVTTLSYTSNNATQAFNQSQIYLKGNITANGKFKLDNTTYTSFTTQVLPTTEDGYVYILLGQMYSTTAMRLYVDHPMYEYSNGRIREYVDNGGLTGNYSTGAGCNFAYKKGLMTWTNCTAI